jgi:hypothetical protein
MSAIISVSVWSLVMHIDSTRGLFRSAIRIPLFSSDSSQSVQARPDALALIP